MMLTKNILSLHNRICGNCNDTKDTEESGTVSETSNADYNKMREEIADLRKSMAETNKMLKELITNGNSTEHLPNSEQPIPTGDGTE